MEQEAPIHSSDETDAVSLRKQEPVLRMLLDLLNQQQRHRQIQDVSLNLVKEGFQTKLLNEDESTLNSLLIAISSDHPPSSEIVDQALQALSRLERQISGALASSSSSSPTPCLNAAAVCKIYAFLIQSQSKPCDITLLKHLARPELLELVASAVRSLKSSAGGESLAALTTLCSFLVDLVKFVGDHSSFISQKTLLECAMVLKSQFLTPSTQGLLTDLVIPQLKSLVDVFATYFHSLKLLQLLFDSPDPVLKILLSDEVISHYAILLYNNMSSFYRASDGNSNSACADLCRLHISTLRSLARGSSSRHALKTVGVLDLLLSEVSMHLDTQSAENVEEEDDDVDDEDLEEEEEEEEDRGSPSPQSKLKSKKQSDKFKETGKFEFSYDLNEDLERILDLEDQLGKNVVLEGFEYDEEGKRLLNKNTILAAQPASTGYQLEDSSSFKICSPMTTDRSRPAIPKLSFSSVSRSALSASTKGVAPSSSSPSILSRPSAVAPLANDAHHPSLVPVLKIPSRLSRETEGAHTVLSSTLNPSPPSTQRQETGGSFRERPPSVRLSPLHMQLYQSAQESLIPLNPGSQLSPRGEVPLPLPLPPRPPVTGRSMDNAPSSVRFRSSEADTADSTLLPQPLPSSQPASSEDHHDDEEGGFNPHPPSSPSSMGLATRPDSTVISRPPLPGLPKLQLVPSLDLSNLAATTARTARAAALSSGPSSRAPSYVNNGTHRLHRSSIASLGSSNNLPPPPTAQGHSSEYRDGKALLDSAADKGSMGGSPGHGAVHRSVVAKGKEEGLNPHDGVMEEMSLDPSKSLLLNSQQVHMQLLRLAFESLLTKQGTLEPSFWTQFPLDSGFKFNLEYLLVWHLSSGPGASLAKELQEKLKSSSSPPEHKSASLRLLRLFARGLFDESRFSELKFQARGAYGSIFRAKDSLASLHGSHSQVIIKTIDLPCGPYERCVLPDIFGEVGIMERYKGIPSICQLIDYGLSSGGEAYWIVMKRYRCSLSEWRLKQPKDSLASPARAALFLSVLLQVVDALLVLASDSVVHFDLKCSNVLIDPSPGVKDTELWSHAAISQEVALNPPFQAVLADFGEARSYRSAEEAFTVRNRGTEVYKSPEMLLLNNIAKEGEAAMPPINSIRRNADSVAASSTSSQALSGAGLASDVWSFGCLAYELLSGQVLFGADYASVTHRVAFGGPGNLRLTEDEKEGLGGQEPLIDLIEWILERAPEKRPSLHMIKHRIKSVRQAMIDHQE